MLAFNVSFSGGLGLAPVLAKPRMTGILRNVWKGSDYHHTEKHVEGEEVPQSRRSARRNRII
eukprot:1394999-Amorphochlora_amoeboformis.AAC.1